MTTHSHHQPQQLPGTSPVPVVGVLYYCPRSPGGPLFHGAGVELVTNATGPEETATRKRGEERGRDPRGTLWLTATPSRCRSIRPGVLTRVVNRYQVRSFNTGDATMQLPGESLGVLLGEDNTDVRVCEPYQSLHPPKALVSAVAVVQLDGGAFGGQTRRRAYRLGLILGATEMALSRHEAGRE